MLDAIRPPSPEGRLKPALKFLISRLVPRSRTIRFEQAVYGSFPFRDQGYALLAHSPGCRPEWLSEFRAACQRIGERPACAMEASGLMALRLESNVWAIVGISPQGLDDRGRPGALGFHGLFLSCREYRKAGSSPFELAEGLRSEWSAGTSTLPSGVRTITVSRSESSEPPSGRVARIALALTKGRRVVIESTAPIDELAREVWAVLPARVRARTSMSTWAFGNGNRFDLLAVPRLAGVAIDGSYEVELQPGTAEVGSGA